MLSRRDFLKASAVATVALNATAAFGASQALSDSATQSIHNSRWGRYSVLENKGKLLALRPARAHNEVPRLGEQGAMTA